MSASALRDLEEGVPRVVRVVRVFPRTSSRDPEDAWKAGKIPGKEAAYTLGLLL